MEDAIDTDERPIDDSSVSDVSDDQLDFIVKVWGSRAVAAMHLGSKIIESNNLVPRG